MYSTAIVLSLLAGSVLSSPAAHGHGHIHDRQIHEVIDIVDVYTTVTLGGPAPSRTAAPKEHNFKAGAVEEKMAEPKQYRPQPPVSYYQPPAPPASSAPAPPPPESSAPAPAPPASSAAPPPTQQSSAPSSGNDYQDLHNQYRNNHGAVQMVWDSTLAAKAQSEVNGCPNDDVQSGSNWYGSSGSSSVESAVNAWYGEMSTYASQTNNYADNPPANPPLGAPETGHFSQMIWNSSTSLGCAMASSCGGSWVTQVICLYEPAGNMVFNGQPQYVENVFPPK